MTLRKLITVAVCLLLIGAGVAWRLLRTPVVDSYPITNASPTGTTIIALGDSLTAGTGAGREASYPSQLADRLGIQIVNRGVPGDTVADALARLDRDVLAADPRIVLVLLGGNDVLRRGDADQPFAKLRQIVDRIQAEGALVILIGLKPPLASSWDKRYADLARETGCPFVPDIMAGILGDPSLKSDEVHPNAAGYAKFANRIEPVLRTYLE